MGVIIVLIGLLSVNLSVAVRHELPCHFLDSINITGGRRLPFDAIQFNGIVYPMDQYAEINYVIEAGTFQITVDPYIRGCICNIKPCLRLCCPLGKLHTDERSTTCRDHDKAKKFEAEVIHENNETKIIPLERYFAYIEGYPCNFMYFDDEYQITHKGKISRGNSSFNITHHNSCLHAELNDKTNDVDLKLLTCIEDIDFGLFQYHYIRQILLICGMLTSVVCIVATLLVYIFIPKLRNLQTNCLICYLVCLGIGFSFVAFIALYGYMRPTICITIGYIVTFSYFSAFCWLNIFNFDFWVNFQSEHSFKQMSNTTKFNCYLLYGFGVPSLLTLFIYILDNVVHLPPDMRPGIDDGACFISNLLWYFYTPIGITILIDSVFFVLIILRIREIQHNINVDESQTGGPQMQKLLNKKKENCILYLRLVFVMGLLWIMEIVSYLIESFSPFFLITDICNTLPGLFVFILLVMNRRVLRLIKERWQNWRRNGTTNDDDSSNLISHSAVFMQMNPVLTTK